MLAFVALATWAAHAAALNAPGASALLRAPGAFDRRGAAARMSEAVVATTAPDIAASPDADSNGGDTDANGAGADANSPLRDTGFSFEGLPRPGLDADGVFEQDPSVEAWRTWSDRWESSASSPTAGGAGGSRGSLGLPTMPNEAIASVADRVRGWLAADPARAVPYWTYHLGRSFYFVSQWLLVYLSSAGRRNVENATATTQGVPRLLGEALGAFADDYACIVAGDYKPPYDMTELRHRQYSPTFAARETAIFLREAGSTLERRKRGRTEAVWVDGSPDLYPDYYKTFHYQTDGWMSSASAAVYEKSTETLFFGRQDAMQRLTLVPLSRLVQDRTAADPSARLDLLELGCGTGRFHTFMLDSFGDRLRTTALDLSPFYLERARANEVYARGLRSWAGREAVRYVLANAEKVPLPDASFDAVVSVYMFHEMPPEALRNVAREVGRLLRPGGVFILTDSQQRGDRPAMDATLGNFFNMNEPHYIDYITTDFGALLKEETGLVPEWKGHRSVTKTMSFRKPVLQGDVEE